ncbi:uncharacterized protein PG986_014420 [Apiospora aurea]|uniref:Uncharacterized protein n=1 Tax=Apiospora aurea TaxID=335848 RepID=A0ABR1PSX6_9PEZI
MAQYVERITPENCAQLSERAIDQRRVVCAWNVELVGFAWSGRPKTEYLMENDEENISIFTRLPQKFESWSFYTRLQSFDPATLPYPRFEDWESLVSQKGPHYSS